MSQIKEFIENQRKLQAASFGSDTATAITTGLILLAQAIQADLEELRYEIKGGLKPTQVNPKSHIYIDPIIGNQTHKAKP